MYAAIVLAGGEGRRMGGVLKPLLRIKERTIISRVLDAVADADRIIVVGPDELAPELPEEAVLTRESPPGGGPAVATAAGFRLCQGADEIVVVAADLPFLTRQALATLRQESGELALYGDDEGRWQPMVARWWAPALSRALESVPVRMKDLLREAGDISALRWTGTGPPPWFDCDTPQDLALAERLL
jgi:molybdopterin-guanine dinucleotide biosynthesis protein A